MRAVLLAVIIGLAIPAYPALAAIPTECTDHYDPDCNVNAHVNVSPQDTSVEILNKTSSSDPWLVPAPTWVKGMAKYYAENLMEKVARRRHFSLEGFVDGVALMSPSDLGRTVWLKHPKRGWEGPFLVVDCSGRDHLLHTPYDQIRVAEVGWKTARSWEMAGPIEGIEVSKVPPQELPHGSPVDYRMWWLNVLANS